MPKRSQWAVEMNVGTVCDLISENSEMLDVGFAMHALVFPGLLFIYWNTFLVRHWRVLSRMYAIPSIDEIGRTVVEIILHRFQHASKSCLLPTAVWPQQSLLQQFHLLPSHHDGNGLMDIFHPTTIVNAGTDVPVRGASALTADSSGRHYEPLSARRI